jgi:hypothetical protein
MKNIPMHTPGPALSRRDAFTVIGAAVVSANVFASPFAEGREVRGSNNNRGTAIVAQPVPFVMSF